MRRLGPVVLVFALACSSSSGEGASQGRADDAQCEGARRDENGTCRLPSGQFAADTCCSSTADQLHQLLAQDGAFQMPPLGVEGGADTLEVAVTKAAIPDGSDLGRRSAVSALVNDMTKKALFLQSADEAVYQLLENPENRANLRMGNRDRVVRDTLLEYVADDKREAVNKLIKGAGSLDAYYVHYQIVDDEAEIIAFELFVIHPAGASEAIVVHLSYFFG